MMLFSFGAFLLWCVSLLLLIHHTECVNHYNAPDFQELSPKLTAWTPPAATVAPLPANASTITITTPLGPIKGVVDPQLRIQRYLGVPYAQKPVNSLRFRPPQPLSTPWTEPYNANVINNCIQAATGTANDPTHPVQGTEDCLYVNIYTPINANNASKLPVMIFIPGGSFTSVNMQDASYMVSRSQGMIAVMMNYRVNVFGFLGHPALSAELQGDGRIQTSANYGLLDQQMVLQWVNRYISSFGGDPTQVTLAGESAGSISVCLHMFSPGSKGLFHRAIMESGGCDISPRTISAAETTGVALLNAAVSIAVQNNDTITNPKLCISGTLADQAACLRALSPQTLFSAMFAVGANNPFGSAALAPVADGVFATDFPANLMKKGAYYPVPLLAGANVAEFGIFYDSAGLVPDWDHAAFYSYGLSFVGNLAPYGYYQSHGYDPQSAIIDMFGSTYFICATRRSVQLMSQSNQTAYLYLFNYTKDLTGLIPPYVVDYNLKYHGAVHSSELPYVFDNPVSQNGIFTGGVFSSDDQDFASTLMQYWVRFIISGDPNSNTVTPFANTGTNWDKYNAALDNFLDMNNNNPTRKGTFSMNTTWHATCAILYDNYVAHPSFKVPYIPVCQKNECQAVGNPGNWCVDGGYGNYTCQCNAPGFSLSANLLNCTGSPRSASAALQIRVEWILILSIATTFLTFRVRP